MTVHETAVPADPAGPVVPSHGPLRPLGLGEITLGTGFWGTMQQINATASLQHCEDWMERLGWLANFDRVADGTTGSDRPGWYFSDSEAYKLLEALAWEHGRTGSPETDAAVRRLTERIGRAQDPDGYLNTAFGHPHQSPRYSDLEMGHELYCTGHLLQAAVARLRTTGADALVDIARRAADHVCATFGPGGNEGICGHPEIEVGLAELGRALGDDRYIEQARVFLDRRGHGTLRGDRVPLGSAYFQDDVPIREAHAWRGHAVRALYLTAAAVDVATERDDRDLLAVLERQWEHTVARRTHITGGMGSRHQDEGFGDDWELPADRAYCESCAGIASVMVSWRLYLATGEPRYADLIERTFYNVIATAPSADGRAFFYANPLHQRTAGHAPDTEILSPRAESGVRAPWFDVSCCPTNLARTLATWHTYAAVADDRGLTLLQYATARIAAPLADGRVLAVDVETAYPRDGVITVRITEAPSGPVALRFRVPTWAVGTVLEEGGRHREVEPGTVTVDREFTPGEEIHLHLPMRARFTRPDPRIDALRGCVAVERGPLVHCVEAVDLPTGTDLSAVEVDPTMPLTDRGEEVSVRAGVRPDHGAAWPYTSATDAADAGEWRELELTLVPYHRWAERGPTAMRVWLPST